MKEVIIIAEAGVNHNGDMNLARALIDAAAAAKVDFVKFQSFKTDRLAKKNAEKAQYQKETSGTNEGQYEMLKRLELSEDQHLELIEYCKKKNVNFLSTPFDEDSATFLSPHVPLFKVSSTDLNNFALLKHLCSFKKPIVLSTGMSELSEIEISVNYISNCWKELGFSATKTTKFKNLEIPHLTVLHCTTAYPTPFEEVNLRAMNAMKEKLKVAVGYSDHTLGIEVAIAATALGAEVIEKHYTLDTSMEGPDHRASLPKELLPDLVSGIRHIQQSLGSSEKKPTETEKLNKKVARKGLYFSTDLTEGTVLNESHIAFMRPTHEIGPEHFFDLIGKKVKKNVEKGSPIKLELFL